jgi:hypothetical protein
VTIWSHSDTNPKPWLWLAIVGTILSFAIIGGNAWASEAAAGEAHEFPLSLESYGDDNLNGIGAKLRNRIEIEPFNLIATLIFLCAITHTFMASKFMSISNSRRHVHAEKIETGEARDGSVDILAEAMHFLGEVEVIFGLWVVPLVAAIVYFHDWPSVVHYIDGGVNLTEAAFVVVIMVLASTRPILRLAGSLMTNVAKLLGGSLGALWFTILTLGPLLGSLITEPAAMTISAMLLSHKFYDLMPSKRFMYATLGLLFVNVSVGGTLTHFAAPPVLMVAGPWGWDTGFMFTSFGWKAIIGILIGNVLYFLAFRKELAELQGAYEVRRLKDEIAQKYVTRELIDEMWAKANDEIAEEKDAYDSVREVTKKYIVHIQERIEADGIPQLRDSGLDPDLIHEACAARFNEARLYHVRKSVPGLLKEAERPIFNDPDWDKRDDPVPAWITVIHVLFMGWTIANVHHPALFILGLLFFLGFAQITTQYQNRVLLQPAIFVGFFLAGLVIHGGVQAWWIAPVLGSMNEVTLMAGATMLTAFNDNAAITYLSTLVPGFTDSLKYAVVAGAVTGGGLTIIANAPNPAGQSILKEYFGNSVSPKSLLLGALIPTIILWLCFAIL